MTTQTILKLETPKAIERWNKLAFANSSELTIAHNPQLFNFFSDYLKLKPFYLFLTEGREEIGLLPLVLIGNKLVSVPHFSYGGILKISPGKKLADESRLIKQLAGLIFEQKTNPGFYEIDIDRLKKDDVKGNKVQIEIRQFEPLFENQNSEKVSHFLALKKSPKDQLAAFNSNLRRKISKAEKNGIEVKIGGVELVDDFSKVYNKNMHQLGSPTLGKAFFKSLYKNLPSNTEIAVAFLKNKPIGCGFCMWYDGYYENTWFSTLQEYNQLYTSYTLHDKIIKSAINKKAHTYSMGRSSINSGVQQYKLQWPVKEKHLFFNSTSSKGVNLKDQKWLTKVWKLLPATLVNNLGPAVAKRIY